MNSEPGSHNIPSNSFSGHDLSRLDKFRRDKELTQKPELGKEYIQALCNAINISEEGKPSALSFKNPLQVFANGKLILVEGEIKSLTIPVTLIALSDTNRHTGGYEAIQEMIKLTTAKIENGKILPHIYMQYYLGKSNPRDKNLSESYTEFFKSVEQFNRVPIISTPILPDDAIMNMALSVLNIGLIRGVVKATIKLCTSTPEAINFMKQNLNKLEV